MTIRTLISWPSPLPLGASLSWSSPSSQTKLPVQREAYLRICCARKTAIRCVESPSKALKTCRHCKSQFDPSLNHPRACRFHTAHFGGETKRKFESVYTGGTMSTPDSGRVFQYWHCCGSEDPFNPGCTAAPHSSYDD